MWNSRLCDSYNLSEGAEPEYVLDNICSRFTTALCVVTEGLLSCVWVQTNAGIHCI